jgi:hypothetical protein
MLVSPYASRKDPVLRIDETSGTLVAPQAGGLVAEPAPARDELLALVAGSWETFAAELGRPELRLVGREPAPGVDLLAVDGQSGRPVVVVVTGETVEWQLARALAAAAEVASWDAARLSEVDAALAPGSSPALLLVAGGFEPAAVATVEWLSRDHGVEIAAFSVSVLRFGNERLLAVHREPAEQPDPSAEVQWMLTGAAPAPAQPAQAVAAVASTPPPGA